MIRQTKRFVICVDSEAKIKNYSEISVIYEDKHGFFSSRISVRGKIKMELHSNPYSSLEKIKKSKNFANFKNIL